MCHKCGQPWYMLRENGSLVVMTDQGMMPRPPVGKRHIITNLFPELTEEDLPVNAEFKDPIEKVIKDKENVESNIVEGRRRD